jgi:hypothetical protein
MTQNPSTGAIYVVNSAGQLCHVPSEADMTLCEYCYTGFVAWQGTANCPIGPDVAPCSSGNPWECCPYSGNGTCATATPGSAPAPAPPSTTTAPTPPAASLGGFLCAGVPATAWAVKRPANAPSYANWWDYWWIDNSGRLTQQSWGDTLGGCVGPWHILPAGAGAWVSITSISWSSNGILTIVGEAMYSGQGPYYASFTYSQLGWVNDVATGDVIASGMAVSAPGIL